MRTVLVIAYYFPPLGMGGVQRILKFVKYLPQYGWLPLVLTTKEVAYRCLDHTLIDEVPRQVEVHRIEGFEPRRILALRGQPRGELLERLDRKGGGLARWLFIPDSKVVWAVAAAQAGSRLIPSRHVDVIFATAPPYSSLLTGLILKRQTRKPLVLDFRDAWSTHPARRFPTPFHRALDRTFERKALLGAERVIAINASICHELGRLLPDGSPHRFEVIPQGYDPDDFPAEPPTHPGESMRISYVGTLGPWAPSEPLLRGLRHALDSGRISAHQIELHFIGYATAEERQMPYRYGLEDLVTFVPYLPHQESVRELLEADVLWLSIAPFLGPTITTGKLYEYLASGKQILASVPQETDAASVLDQSGAAIRVDPDDTRGMEQALVRLHQMYREDRLAPSLWTKLKDYDRRVLAQRLASILDGVVDRTQRRSNG